MEKFRNMVPDHATVLRDGNNYSVTSQELVIGDIIKLTIGLSYFVIDMYLEM